MKSLAPRSLLALGAVALSLFPAAAHALQINVFNSHFLQADTSASDPVFDRVFAVDDLRFDGSLSSSGLGSQGATGTATASQSVLYDAQGGASGSLESSVALGSGISGNAAAVFFVPFEITTLTSFALSAFSEITGNAFSVQHVSLVLDPVGSPSTEIFDFELATPSLGHAGLLNPGFYKFRIDTETTSVDPGESGRGRIDFEFRLDPVAGGQALPEPGSLALAAGALALLARARRARPSAAEPAQPVLARGDDGHRARGHAQAVEQH